MNGSVAGSRQTGSVSRRRTRTRTTTLASALIALAAIAAVLIAVQQPRDADATTAPPILPGTAAEPDTAPTAEPEPDPGTLAAQAAALPTIDESAATPDYRRDAFGEAWTDIDGNGCNQRQDVLVRDLVDITTDRCTVLTGTLHDRYSGQTITFQHDRVAQPGNPGSPGVQIDHIVSLSAAWRGGAWAWAPERRLAYANTLANLLAVDGPTNQAKSDLGPSDWMPPVETYRCTYAASYVAIATEWTLSVADDDRAALVSTLQSCG